VRDALQTQRLHGRGCMLVPKRDHRMWSLGAALKMRREFNTMYASKIMVQPSCCLKPESGSVSKPSVASQSPALVLPQVCATYITIRW
jgi:hypothetical protein